MTGLRARIPLTTNRKTCSSCSSPPGCHTSLQSIPVVEWHVQVQCTTLQEWDSRGRIPSLNPRIAESACQLQSLYPSRIKGNPKFYIPPKPACRGPESAEPGIRGDSIVCSSLRGSRGGGISRTFHKPSSEITACVFGGLRGSGFYNFLSRVVLACFSTHSSFLGHRAYDWTSAIVAEA